MMMQQLGAIWCFSGANTQFTRVAYFLVYGNLYVVLFRLGESIKLWNLLTGHNLQCVMGMGLPPGGCDWAQPSEHNHKVLNGVEIISWSRKMWHVVTWMSEIMIYKPEWTNECSMIMNTQLNLRAVKRVGNILIAKQFCWSRYQMVNGK